VNESVAARRRNPRGHGGRLREEILAGATRLLEASGSEESVTLRSVAREVGIAAPSIYAHFADREAIVDAVVDAAFVQLGEATGLASDGSGQDPVTRLLAGCQAYARFAMERPGRYRMMFGRVRPDDATTQTVNPVRRGTLQSLADAIGECAAAGRSASTDAWGDAVELWSGMHGAVSLRIGLPRFPFPPLEHTIDTLTRRLAQVTN
jgi:AcrR family transcriptional regulator